MSENQAKNAATHQKQLKVFIGGITSNTTEQDIKAYFSKFGRVTRAVVNKEHYTNKPRGSGFVIFNEASSVKKVLSQSDHILRGKKFDCQPCLLREEIEKSKKQNKKNQNNSVNEKKVSKPQERAKKPHIMSERNENSSGRSQQSLSDNNSVDIVYNQPYGQNQSILSSEYSNPNLLARNEYISQPNSLGSFDKIISKKQNKFVRSQSDLENG